jgi:hypothetical protein
MSADPVNIFLTILLIIIAGWLLKLGMVIDKSRVQALLDKWSAAMDCTILSAEHRRVLRGPFFWNSSKYQRVYRVQIVDRTGRHRTVWLRLGGYWRGLSSGETDASWEE